jgi:DNA polymerase III epsilon subunit-like protein
MTRFITIDTETSGFPPAAGVCEFAYAELDEGFNIILEDNSLIDPEMPISASASGVHGIVDEDVVDSPTLAEYMYMVNDAPLKGNVVIIGHNVDFDLKFIGPYIPNLIGKICTLRLARMYMPDAENHKLSTLMHLLKLPRRNSHRADSDVFTTVGLLRHLGELSGQTLPELLQAMNNTIKVTKMPFGKHKGEELKAVPSSYRSWLLGTDNLDADLRKSLEELK